MTTETLVIPAPSMSSSGLSADRQAWPGDPYQTDCHSQLDWESIAIITLDPRMREDDNRNVRYSQPLHVILGLDPGIHIKLIVIPSLTENQ